MSHVDSVLAEACDAATVAFMGARGENGTPITNPMNPQYSCEATVRFIVNTALESARRAGYELRPANAPGGLRHALTNLLGVCEWADFKNGVCAGVGHPDEGEHYASIFIEDARRALREDVSKQVREES